MTDGPSRLDQFVEDILVGPDELAAALDHHGRGIAEIPPELLGRPRWRFAGMGSSLFAALDAAAAMRATGRDAAAELASSSSWSPPGHDTLVIAISNSGRTPEVVAAADHHRGHSHVVALTGRVESPLSDRADIVLPLVAGRAEQAGISNLSYRSTVAALRLFSGAVAPELGATGMPAAVPALEALLKDRGDWLGGAADALDTGRPIHVLGDGARIGGVAQAALMLREAPRIEAIAYDTGDWLHVGLYTLFPGDVVLLFTGSPADGETIATVHARDARVVTVGAPHPDGDLAIPLPDAAVADPAVRALVEPAVAEVLAAELWRRADAETVSEGPPA